MKFKPLFLAASLGLFCSTLFADENQVHERITAGLKQIAPALEIDSIQPSPIPGLYLVLSGADVLYVSEDGRYVINGDMYDVNNEENLSEKEKSHVRADALQNIGSEEFIEFAPEKVAHTLYVFTDISCGYCRKLHLDIPELNKNGIAIRYLAYPRGGVHSNASYELSAVWCADDKNKALTDAKAGVIADDIQECDDPVAKHYALGQDLGVRGTPAIFMENGQAIPGYFPPDKLTQIVNR